MQNANIRYLFHLLRNALIGILLLLAAPKANAQQTNLNMLDHDAKPYYFGITLAANQSYFKLEHSPAFLATDSIMIAEPMKTMGFNLGLLANARLTEHFDLRFNPQLVFASKNLYYRDTYPKPQDTEKKIESILLSFPVQIKFKSDRIGNMRVYTIGGLKYDYDLSSNARLRRADDLVKIRKGDYGYELGAGFEFYFESFIFSPEFKISNGFGNVHVKDPNLRYSNVVDKLQSRMIVFSIHLEG
ncbi:probable protein-translocating porin PorT (TC 1.B.44.1.1) [Chitinophaga terrae (ex Kim and Jung 2007)]|uniref:Probable protein-translocating porin PorT (TC 1.B.44.1.1) n=1 Tax=Chitinophaga terrae (ex Kim and Jung 2007) TaxID=408074 RepID=A0A1H4DQC6_9BACT|nr:probable protein-translocating porin PorT (TC 1.B.44.1.1) [Chitinophaga terrae (ex Kim and Jung 2007)]